MGYYLNVLQEGAKYELDGERLVFIGKKNNLYYFYLCKYDSSCFDYVKTNDTVLYKIRELNFIKKVQDGSIALRRIGRDKVFGRN
jgi:hypothetical protein